MLHGPSAAGVLITNRTQLATGLCSVRRCGFATAAPSAISSPPRWAARLTLLLGTDCPQLAPILAGQLDAEVLGYPYSVSDGLSLSVLERRKASRTEAGGPRS